ncbi:MAG TPA: PfkB family carbohydrate kinase, partial [Arenibaculum sp.]|nr:PfkB family carbohydrate kinase [Arenibaculum sp.]
MKRKVAVIGECMLELADRGGGEARFGFGGDTLNTAVYLARAGVGVDYVTDLGDDPYSQSMIAAWQAEGIDTRFVGRRPGALPGLYV